MSLALHYPFSKNPTLEAAVGAALACTRATTRSMPDADGWIREVQANEAAFQGATFRHNLGIQSNAFNLSPWVELNVEPFTTPDSVGRDGVTVDAWALVADGLGAGVEAVGVRYDALTALTSTGHTYLCSFYAKAGTKNWLYAYNSAAAGTSSTRVYYDLANGVLGTVSANIIDAGMEAVGNDWYRCWYVFEDVNDNNRSYCQIADADGGEAIDNSGAPQTVVYLQDFQHEDVSGRWDSYNTSNYSESPASWTQQSSAAAGVNNVVANPIDGEITAGELSDDGLGGSDQCLWSVNNVSAIVGGHYFQSAYVKKKTGGDDYCSLWVVNAGAKGGATYFNISTGAVESSSATVIDAGVVDIGDGWYRIWHKVPIDSADTVVTTRLYLSEDGSTNTITNTDGTHGFYIYGHQLELAKPNQTLPGTYVKTPSTTKVETYSPGDYIATTTVAKSELSGANDGLVDWEARTNLQTYSEEFDNATYTKVNATITPDQTLAPDGSLTADLFADDAAGSGPSNEVRIDESWTVSSSTQYCRSVFIKADQSSVVQLRLSLTGTPNILASAYFDLSTASVGTTANTDDEGIEDYGNGWYRCWLTATSPSDGVNGSAYINIADADNDNLIADDGTNSIFVWGAQLEAGTKPSPYIRTTTGAVTANGEFIKATPLNGAIPVDGFTTYFRGKTQVSDVTNNRYLFYFDDGTATDRVYMWIDTGDDINAGSATSAGSGTINLNSAMTQALDTVFEAVMRFDPDNSDAKIWSDGVERASDVTVDPLGDAPTQIFIGNVNATAAHLNGTIEEFRLYNQVFDDDTSLAMSLGNFPSEGQPRGPGLTVGRMGGMGRVH